MFFSNLVCEKDDEIIKIDSRTSDAIALSLRFNAPIFIDKVILDEAGFDDDEKYKKAYFTKYSTFKTNKLYAPLRLDYYS